MRRTSASTLSKRALKFRPSNFDTRAESAAFTRWTSLSSLVSTTPTRASAEATLTATSLKISPRSSAVSSRIRDESSTLNSASISPTSLAKLEPPSDARASSDKLPTAVPRDPKPLPPTPNSTSLPAFGGTRSLDSSLCAEGAALLLRLEATTPEAFVELALKLPVCSSWSKRLFACSIVAFAAFETSSVMRPTSAKTFARS
mmetsp:Transcript_61835/g.172694  ORF Transcript_61835/g.172694 Transcript_61835/m.172694 type:complete len:202 (-) Transcript_61835:1196-1801(-)